jgi:hypothetical protein
MRALEDEVSQFAPRTLHGTPFNAIWLAFFKASSAAKCEMNARVAST